MKFIKKLSVFILSACLLLACSGNNSSSTVKDSASDNATSSVKSSLGDAHFSCIIDGQPVSGGEIKSYQGPEGYKSNEAHIADGSHGNKGLLFYLSDPKNENSQGVHSLGFAVPYKTGTSSFGHDEDGWGIEVDIIVNKDHTARYTSDSFTINISSLSATRVSGTFSGKFKLNGNVTDTDKKEIEVTDGKFDIPFSKK